MDFKRLTRANTAACFGVDPSTITRWKKAGCPCNPDGKTFNSAAVHQWKIDQIEPMASPDDNVDSPALERYREARANMVELDLEVKRGALISRKEVHEAWAGRVVEVAAGLNFLADRLPPLLVGKSRDDIRDIISDEVWKLRDVYARTGRHCEAAD